MFMVSIRSVLRGALTFTLDVVCAGGRGGCERCTNRCRRDSGRYVATLTLAKVVKFSVEQHWSLVADERRHVSIGRVKQLCWPFKWLLDKVLLMGMFDRKLRHSN